MLLLGLTVAHADPPPVRPVPDWVEVVEADLRSPVPDGAVRPSVQYLLVDDQVRAGDSISRYRHLAYRIVTHEGLDDLSRLQVDFDPASARVWLHSFEVYRDGAWHDRLGDTEAVVIQREESLWQHIYDGVTTLVAIPPDIRVGDVVSYAYSLDGYNPVFGGLYSDAWDMAWSVPAERRVLRLQYPVDRDLHVQAHGRVPPPSHDRVGDWQETRWDLGPVPASPGVEDAPVDYVAWPWVQVSAFSDWGAVARWAARLYALPDGGGDEVRALAQSIAPADASDDEVITAALRWVQDEVRYFGIEMGEGSHAPRAPAEVLRRRYGDCKDKSLLLVALLRARGIEAWPVLVNSEEGRAIGRQLPSPTVFNHVIVAVRRGEGLVFGDPTRNFQGGGADALYVPDYGKGLLVRPDGTGLVDVVRSRDGIGSLETRYLYRVTETTDTIELQVSTCADGGRAEQYRAWLADTTPEAQQARFINSIREPGVTVTPWGDVRVGDDREGNRLCIEEHYDLDGVWKEAEGGDEIFETWTPELLSWLPAIDPSARSAPLALPAGVREAEEIRIDAPDDWDLVFEPHAFDTPWFSFRTTVERPGDSPPDRQAMVMRYELEVTDNAVPTGSLGEYEHQRQLAGDVTGYAITRPGAARPPVDGPLVYGVLAAWVLIFFGLPTAIVVTILLTMTVGGIWSWRRERRLRSGV